MEHTISKSGYQKGVSQHMQDMSLMDYVRVLLRYKNMIIFITVTVSICAIIISSLLPKSYEAHAVIIPISSRGGGGVSSSLSSQLGGLASIAGVSLSGSAGDAEKILTILRSRSLAENVIKNNNLMPILFWKNWDSKANKWKDDFQPSLQAAVLVLQSIVKSSDDKKTKTIKILGEYRDPIIVADFVNAYIVELQKFINDNAITLAKRNRIFIEKRLAQNKEELLEASKEINGFYKGNRISSSEAKVDVPISDLMQADVAYNDGNNGRDNETSSIEGTVSTLYQQTDGLEKKLAEIKVVKNVPQQVYLGYLMLRQELLTKVNSLLTTQYEMAKIEESKEELAFQVIDKAIPPLNKSKPHRKKICLGSFIAAVFFAVLLAFMREYMESLKRDTNQLTSVK